MDTKELYLLYSKNLKEYEILVEDGLKKYQDFENQIKKIANIRIELEKILEDLKNKGENIDLLINNAIKKNDNSE